jgi:S-adenosylmethionine hydrolase
MITLTTDFGLKDPYVAEMKGVILTINPKAQIIDLSHGVDKFNVRTGAFILASAVRYFPSGTIHVAVVDPGVGTKRRAILVQTKKDFFVGPDNGILILAAQNQIIEHIYQLSNSKFLSSQVSTTFHGRDVFAPAAAYLDLGTEPSEFGSEIYDVMTPDFTIMKYNHGIFMGEILYLDSFGNIITNIISEEILKAKAVNIELHNVTLNLSFVKNYTQAKPSEPIALIGSHGFVEIALNQSSAAKKLHVQIGDKIKITAASL